MEELYEQLISFETAKLAEERGFDIRTAFCYVRDGIKCPEMACNGPKCYIPTQSLLKKWLRTIHKIHIIVNPTVTDNWTFALCNIGNENIELNGEVIYDSTDYNSYEEALEKGLIKALKLLKK